MEQDKLLLDSHGIAYKLQVQLMKLPSTATAATQKKQSEKFTSQLKLNYNDSSKLNEGINSNCQSDREHLISNGITSHVRISVKRQDLSQMLENKLDCRNSREPSPPPSCDRPAVGLSAKKAFKCPICTHHLELSIPFLRNHLIANHRSKKLLKCSFLKCNFSTWFPHFFEQHYTRVHQQLPFDCSACSEKFKNLSALQFHLALSHSAGLQVQLLRLPPSAIFSSSTTSTTNRHLQNWDSESETENGGNYLQENEVDSKFNSDQEPLMSNGTMSHVRIHSVGQEVDQLLDKFDTENSRKSLYEQDVDVDASKSKAHQCPICPRHVELSIGFFRNHPKSKHWPKI